MTPVEWISHLRPKFMFYKNNKLLPPHSHPEYKAYDLQTQLLKILYS